MMSRSRSQGTEVMTVTGAFSVQNGGGNSPVMGAAVAMERSIEFRFSGFYTLHTEYTLSVLDAPGRLSCSVCAA